jgi:PAS domain S-box-containing protein
MALQPIDPANFKRILRRTIVPPLIAMGLLAGVLLWSIGYLLTTVELVDHSDQVLAQAQQSQKLIVDMETGLRGYLLTAGPEFLEPYRQASAQIGPAFDSLAQLIAGDPAQSQRLLDLRAQYAQWEIYARDMIGRRDRGGDYQSAAINLQGKRLMDDLRAQLAAFTNAEETVRNTSSQTARRASLQVVGISIGLALVIGVALASLGRRQLLVVSHSYGQALAVAQDRAEELEQQRERMRVTLSSIGDAVIVTDAHGRVTFANPVAQALIGWSQAEALEQPLETVFKIVNETTRQPIESPVDRVIRKGTIVGMANHTVLIARDGAEIPIDDSAAPIRDAQGNIDGIVMVFRDITERRRAESRLRFLAAASALLSSSLDYATTFASLTEMVVPELADWCAIYFLQADGTIKQIAMAHANASKVELGWALDQRYPPAPDAPTGPPYVIRSGQPTLVTHVSDSRLAARARDDDHLAILRELGVQSYMIVPLIARDHVLGAISFVTGESGRHYGAADLALAEDLARRAAVAVDNARLYQEAQDAIRARDQFLSIASHELKTPLTSLMGYTELIQRRAARDGAFAERDQHAIRIIGEQSGRLNRLITALLDLSRIETGQLSIERGLVSLSALARRLVEETQPTLDRHTVRFSAPDDPLVVGGDELRLEQVIQNLIQNAIKYSPSGGAVTVHAERRGNMACVSVGDDGIGIPQAALPQLFRRFYRAPNAEARHIRGMGIGLYVVREIVTLHGGEVTVESQEGAGSTFTVCIPLIAERQPNAVRRDSAL